MPVMFEQVGDSRSSPIADWGPLVASLTAAALGALFVGQFFPPEREALGPAILRSAIAVSTVFAASFASVWIAFRLLRPRTSLGWGKTAVTFAGTGTLLLPIVVMAWDGAAWLAIIAGTFSIAVARLAGSYRDTLASMAGPAPGYPAPAVTGPLFMGRVAAQRSGWQWIAVVCATAFQCGLVALGAGIGTLGASLFAAGGLLFAWAQNAASGMRIERRMRPHGAFVLAGAAMVVLALIGRYGEPPLYPGHVAGGSERGRQSAAQAGRDMHSGVILKSPNVARVVLIAPRLRATRATRVSPSRSPMNIPFSGEYWFIPWMRRAPTSSALVQRGSPFEWVFTIPEREPLKMLARQHMGGPLAVSFCSAVDLNLVFYPYEADTVDVMLYLARTREKGRPETVMLGARKLSEIQGSGTAREGERIHGTLRFQVPAKPGIEDFDEVHVIFNLLSPRMHRSAKAEVESLTLVP